MLWGFVVVVLVVVLLLLRVAFRLASEPVPRSQLERFAHRQRLTVTTRNGPLLLRALGLTHRWRILGLWAGLLAAGLWAARNGQLSFNFTAAFLGWFVGAVVAEWRIAGIPVSGGRRLASLERRTVRGYLNAEATFLLGLALVVLAAALTAALWLGPDEGGETRREATAWLAGILVGLVLVAATLRRVVTRPQPPAAPDLVAADDALRARAAAVLAGSVIAALGFPTGTAFELVGRGRAVDQGSWSGIGFAVMVLEVVVGYLVATRANPARVHGASRREVGAQL